MLDKRNCCYLYYGANATEHITLLRTLAGPDGTGYDGCLHVSIVVRIVRRRGIKFVVVIVAVDAAASAMIGQHLSHVSIFLTSQSRNS